MQVHVQEVFAWYLKFPDCLESLQTAKVFILPWKFPNYLDCFQTTWKVSSRQKKSLVWKLFKSFMLWSILYLFLDAPLHQTLFFGFKEGNWLGYIQHINLFGFVSIPDMLNSIMLIKQKAATSMALSIMRVRMSFGVLTCHWSILPYCVMKIQEININYQGWLEISPRCGGISIYGRISHRCKELELTLVGFTAP